jgi:hypothetical protein
MTLQAIVDRWNSSEPMMGGSFKITAGTGTVSKVVNNLAPASGWSDTWFIGYRIVTCKTVSLR